MRRAHILAVLLALSATACDAGNFAGLPPGPAGGVQSSPGLASRQGPASLTVAEPDSAHPYDRDQWQPHGWEDLDGDGCNTRAEVLMAASTTPVTRSGRCTITTGSWDDPYTGRYVTTAAQLQIDHVVALGDAHRSGGWAWTAERKVAFANAEGDELVAVWGPENEAKSDDGPSEWSPPVVGYRCAYVERYVAVKVQWGLTVSPADAAAIAAQQRECG